MIATAADYAWFRDRPAGLSEAYCLTLARGLTPAEFLSRVGARPDSVRHGIQALFEPSMMLWDDEHMGRNMLIGVTPVPGDGGDWALGVEINGFLGVTEEVIIPLSTGTRVVSHSRNINAVRRFYWIEDGHIRLYFEPEWVSDPEGSMSGILMDVMDQVGFDLTGGGEAMQVTGASMALAEYLTGVRLTPEMLEEATYQCGLVPAP